MRLSQIDNRPGEWPVTVDRAWQNLLLRVNGTRSKVGHSDAFDQARTALKNMVRLGRFDGLKVLLGRRLGARALTWLWLHDELAGPQLFNERMIVALIDQQQPRLSRLTLLQLIQLYFRKFDLLDKPGADTNLRSLMERHLLRQLELLPEKQRSRVNDPLHTLKIQGSLLLTLEGPESLVRQVQLEGSELDVKFTDLGLLGYDAGRYGDLCRAHYYLDVLRQLRPGESDPVLDELSKSSVSKAPYGGGRRIGHAALEILIDRGGEEPGKVWLDFILGLAGDPRITGSASLFREWWLPLGEARIAQVRGWLVKEDLRLFLQAVEQYGLETDNSELRRMFPARKRFLEGLYNLGHIRDARLMLGRSAQSSVKRILGGEIKTAFASMDGVMSDKAVIYLDCGDFHLVEGSHSFKVWVYLAQPGASVKFDGRRVFSHSDLTVLLPKDYKAAHPDLPYEAVTHNGNWQRKVFEFLAQNGIGLDIEQLLSKVDYKTYLIKHGLPVVTHGSESFAPSPIRPAIPTELKSLGVPPASNATESANPKIIFGATPPGTAPATRLDTEAQASLNQADIPPVLRGLRQDELQVLQYFIDNPGDKVRYAANILGIEAREINRMLYGALSAWLQQVDSFGWAAQPRLIRELERTSAP